ncbi:MAG: S-layer homology domain-containing protein [Clostridiales bacterium]|nr:S-layer homology domain-containing protein [Clostridiales bacterium]
MKKLFMLTVLLLFAFSINAYADTGKTTERYIDAEEAGSSKVPIEGLDGCYITADPTGSYVNIVNAYGSKLTNTAFKCVYNKADYGSYLKVRYYKTNDLSGFTVLNKDLEEIIPQSHYHQISAEAVKGSDYFVCDKRDENGTLTADYYWLGYNFEFEGLKEIYSADGELTQVSRYAKERIAAAQESGLIPDNMKYNYFSDEITRYDMACLALDVVLDKYNTNIYSYITENNISLNYGKYLDVVSPNILLAEEMGLIKPSDSKYFKPNEAITRQEAAYILNRLCEIFEVETTPKETLFEDDGDIADWAREAVYNVSGTRTDDTYILAQAPANSFMPNETDYSLERAVMAVWRIANWDIIDFSEYETNFRNIDIGCGLYACQNSDGKWGVYGNGFSVDAFYELPCNSDRYYAFDGYFTLALYDIFCLQPENSGTSRTDNTYFVFNGDGELIKTLTYGIEDIQSEKPCGCVFVEVIPVIASGSNIIFDGMTEEDKSSSQTSYYTAFIKRLVSEKIAGEEYTVIRPYENIGFTATEKSTGKKCVLNADGSFKEYIEE